MPTKDSNISHSITGEAGVMQCNLLPHRLKLIRCARRAGKDARDMLVAHQAKGAGYAISRPEELQTVIDVAESTGVLLATLLHPLYSCLGMLRGHHSNTEWLIGLLLGSNMKT